MALARYLVLAPTLTALCLSGALAQVADDTFSDVTQVTAHEVLVGAPAAKPKRPFRSQGQGLAASDFVISVDGRPLQATGLSRASDRAWLHLLYIDRRLSSPEQIRWIAEMLLAKAEALLARGALEIVVADPVPSVVLPATRDSRVVEEALTRLALPHPSPHHLGGLRVDFLRALANEDLGMEPSIFATLVLAEERRLVQQQMDRLLGHLEDSRSEQEAPQALVLAAGEVDLAPDEFYAEALGTAGLGFAGLGELTEAVETLARNIAALGWVTLGFDGPGPDDLLVEGLRIGKWRLVTPAWALPAFLFAAVRESERKPELAEANLELGQSLLEAGKASEARDALERAIHHFARDPRTARSQAVAWRELGRALESLDEVEAALRASKTAARLEPSISPVYAQLVAAEATERTLIAGFDDAGIAWTVSDEKDLQRVLLDLKRLVIIGFETDGLHDGRLHSLAVSRSQKGSQLIHAKWAPSGTSPGLASARLRRTLAEGSLETGGLGAQIDVVPSPRALAIEVTVEPEQLALDARLRVSLAAATPRGVEVAHHNAEQLGESETWRVVAELPAEAQGQWVVMAEDLATGEWTVRFGDTTYH